MDKMLLNDGQVLSSVADAKQALLCHREDALSVFRHMLPAIRQMNARKRERCEIVSEICLLLHRLSALWQELCEEKGGTVSIFKVEREGTPVVLSICRVAERTREGDAALGQQLYRLCMLSREMSDAYRLFEAPKQCFYALQAASRELGDEEGEALARELLSKLEKEMRALDRFLQELRQAEAMLRIYREEQMPELLELMAEDIRCEKHSSRLRNAVRTQQVRIQQMTHTLLQNS